MIDMIIMMHDAAETIIKLLPLFQLYNYDADILWVVMNRRRWDTLFLLTKIRKCLRSFIKLRIYFVYFINPYYGDMMDNIFYYYYLLF